MLSDFIKTIESIFSQFSLQPRDNADLKTGSLTFAMSEVEGAGGAGGGGLNISLFTTNI